MEFTKITIVVLFKYIYIIYIYIYTHFISNLKRITFEHATVSVRKRQELPAHNLRPRPLILLQQWSLSCLGWHAVRLSILYVVSTASELVDFYSEMSVLLRDILFENNDFVNCQIIKRL